MLVLSVGFSLAACVDSPTAIIDNHELAAAEALAFQETEWGQFLSSRLSDSLGVCIVARRLGNGTFVSRRTKVEVPSGPVSAPLLRVAYRGWRSGVPVPVLLTVCNITNTDAAKQFMSQRLGGEHMTPTGLRSFLSRSGVESAASVMHDSRVAKGVYFVDGVLASPHVSFSMSDGTIGDMNSLADLTDCPPLERRSGAWPSARPAAVATQVGSSPQSPHLDIVCDDWMEEGEYVPDTEPEPDVDPGESQVELFQGATDSLAYAVPVTCYIRSDYPHLSTTTGYTGNLNAKSSTDCPVTIFMTVANTLKRETCIIGIFCWEVPISASVPVTRVSTWAQSISSSTCGWRVGWYKNSGYHFISNFWGSNTGTTASGWRKIYCW